MLNRLTLSCQHFLIYLKQQSKFDFIAGIVVFLVAMPLCLSVAIASGAPLFSGLLSGIIGGIVVGLLSNSKVSISGPSPGMAAIVIAAIAQLGISMFFYWPWF